MPPAPPWRGSGNPREYASENKGIDGAVAHPQRFTGLIRSERLVAKQDPGVQIAVEREGESAVGYRLPTRARRGTRSLPKETKPKRNYRIGV